MPGERVMPRFDDAAARPPVSVMLGVEQDVDLDDDATVAGGTRTATRPQPGRRATGEGRAAKGRYRIDSELARGGMGAILRAFDQDVRREIAMKVMLAEAPSKNAVARFLEEGQVTGQLEHPNIVPVYEVGLDAAQRLYFTMKMVRGQSLKQRVSDARQDVAGGRGDRSFTLMERVEVFRKICDGLAFAHSRGVIHRDLKPDNVMVGQFGEVQVMDWGLAKIIGRAETHGDELVVTDRSEDEDLGRTRAGAVAGTPAYMPPEQAAGKIDLIDERSDIYSLGAILYELLTFSKPFVGTSVLDLLSQVKKGSLVPPGERVQSEFSTSPDSRPQPTQRASRSTSRRGAAVSPASGRRATARVGDLPIVPRELEAVVLKAMARRQGDRYRSVMDLRADVDAWLEGRTVGAADYTSWQLLTKWVQRNKAVVIGSAAVLLVAIVGLVGMFAVSAQKEAEARQAKIDAAESLYAGADSDWNDVAARPFTRAAAQNWFQTALPPLLDMSSALRDHPAPAADWRETVAQRAQQVQERAQQVGDWALASVMARLSPIDSDSRLATVERERVAAADRDRKRLDEALARIAAAERPGSQGSLVPGEMEERARMVARDGGADFTSDVLRRLEAAEGTPRRFLIEVLGRRGDSETTVDGRSTATLIHGAFFRPPDPHAADETAAWVICAARVAAVQPGSFRTVDSDLDNLQQDWGPGPVDAAVRRAREHLAVTRDGGRLASPERDLESYRVQADMLADYIAASSTSGLEFTRSLLQRSSDDALSARQQTLVYDLMGLNGDTEPPDADRPKWHAIQILEEALVNLRQAWLREPGPPDVERQQLVAARDRAVVIALSLARLGDQTLGPALLQYRLSAGTTSAFHQRTAVAAAIAGTGGSSAAGSQPMSDAAKVEALVNQAMAKHDMNDFRGSLADAQAALAIDPDHATAWTEVGNAYAGLGDSERAIAAYNRALELRPDSIATRQNLAYMLADLGQTRRALQIINEAIRLDARQPYSFVTRAHVQQAIGDYGAAYEDYAEALRINPDAYIAYVNRGVLYSSQGQLQKAIADFSRGIELSPNTVEAWVGRAHCQRDLGHIDEALSDYSRCLELEPAHMEARVNRGQLLFTRGDAAGALADYEIAQKNYPDHPAVWINYGVMLFDMGERERAEAAVRKGMALLPPDEAAAWEAHLRNWMKDRPAPPGGELPTAASSALARASNLMEQGLPDEAMRQIELAARLAPDHPIMLEMRGRCLHLLKRYEESYRELTRCIELANGDPTITADALCDRSRACIGMNDFQGAIDDAKEAVRISPDYHGAQYALANALANAGRKAEALKAADRAVELSDQDPELLCLRGNLRSDLGDPAGGVEDFDRAIRLRPNDPHIWFLRGFAKLKFLGDAAGALEDLKQASRLKPESIDYQLLQANAYESMARWQDALNVYAGILGPDADQPGALFGRASLYAQLRMFREAMADVERLLRVTPDNVDALVLRGRIRTQTGDAPGAKADLDRALALNPDHLIARQGLGDLFVMTGRAADAEREYRHALRISPHNPTISNSLGTALLNQGKLAEALDAILDADRHSPSANAEVRYNMACVYGRIATARAAHEPLPATTPQHDAAVDAGIAAFDSAVTLGWNQGAWADQDTDLDGLRNDPRFRRIRDRMR